MGKILDGKAFANELGQNLKEKVKNLKEKGITPHFCVINIGDDPASKIYVRTKKRRAKKMGIIQDIYQMPADTEQAEALALIDKLNAELEDTENCENFNFTPQDILLKRDIDYINRVKLASEYKARTKTWKDYTREEKSDLIMRYVDEIKLKQKNNLIYVDEILFRESICKPCNELFDKGYIDIKTPAIFGNLVGELRFSNYLPEEEVGKHIMRLRQYYDVGFEEAIYYVEDRVFYFDFMRDDRAIIRVFPLEDYCKIDPDIKLKEQRYGIIYIRGKDEFQMQDIDSAFDYIPDESNTSVIYMKEPVPIEIGVKPVNMEVLNNDTSSQG